MCDFCAMQGEGSLCDKSIFDIDVDFGLLGRCVIVGQMYKATGNTEMLNIGIIVGNKSVDNEIKINYCPMCGRKLGKGINSDV